MLILEDDPPGFFWVALIWVLDYALAGEPSGKLHQVNHWKGPMGWTVEEASPGEPFSRTSSWYHDWRFPKKNQRLIFLFVRLLIFWIKKNYSNLRLILNVQTIWWSKNWCRKINKGVNLCFFYFPRKNSFLKTFNLEVEFPEVPEALV